MEWMNKYVEHLLIPGSIAAVITVLLAAGGAIRPKGMSPEEADRRALSLNLDFRLTAWMDSTSWMHSGIPESAQADFIAAYPRICKEYQALTSDPSAMARWRLGDLQQMGNPPYQALGFKYVELHRLEPR